MKFSLFRKLRKKARFGKSHGSRYYYQENVVKDQAELMLILKPLPKTKITKANKTFSINGMPLGEITHKILKAKSGIPSYILWNNEYIPKHKVYYYREHIGLYKFLMQYHFIDNRFFFASNRISSHNRLTQNDKSEIVGQLIKKYTGKEKPVMKENFEIKLTDEEGNIIFTNDTVYYYINYLPNNETTRNLIKKLGIDTDDREKLTMLREDINELI